MRQLLVLFDTTVSFGGLSVTESRIQMFTKVVCKLCIVMLVHAVSVATKDGRRVGELRAL